MHIVIRNLVTNLNLTGFPALAILKISAHRTERAFLKYIRMSEEDNAYKMAGSVCFRNDFIKE